VCVGGGGDKIEQILKSYANDLSSGSCDKGYKNSL
jgi:hypothetical protein